MEKAKSITRKQLHDLVWSKPLTQIAIDYGFSDNSIRKICKRHDIPLPKVGYWSKVRHNKKVRKGILSKQNENPEIVFDKSNPLIDSGNGTLSKIDEIKSEIDRDEQLDLIVPNKLSRPHKFTKATILYEKEQKKQKREGYYGSDIDETNVLSIGVSDNIYKRSIRLMDTLIKALEKRNFELKIDNQGTKISKLNQVFLVRLAEKHKRIKKETGSYWQEFDLQPTGYLCLKINTFIPIKEWSDTKTKPLEEKLIDVVAWLEVTAKTEYEDEIQREIRRKEHEELQKKEEALQKKKDVEFEKFMTVLDSATRWHKSQQLRSYIREFENYATKTNTLNSEKKEWIRWIEDKADWYDPFIEKEDKLLEDIDRDTLRPEGRNVKRMF